MPSQPLFFWNEKHAKSQPNVLDFTYQITAAKTVSPVPQGADSLTSFDAITQATIDNYLGVANDFPATYFDATAMVPMLLLALSACRALLRFWLKAFNC